MTVIGTAFMEMSVPMWNWSDRTIADDDRNTAVAAVAKDA